MRLLICFMRLVIFRLMEKCKLPKDPSGSFIHETNTNAVYRRICLPTPKKYLKIMSKKEMEPTVMKLHTVTLNSSTN